MKQIWIVLLVLAVGVFAWAAGHAQQHGAVPSALAVGQNGRYQLSEATIDFSAMNGMPARRTVIRVDTQTGKTWELTELKTATGGFESFWLPLSETN